MDLITAWLLFPALLLLLSIGCGLLVERAVGVRVPGALVPGVGFSLIVVATQFLALSEATAELIAPVAVMLAVIGFGLAATGFRGDGGRRRVDRLAIAAAAAAYVLFAAPIVLSGEATFAGYIKLDDTATWMTFTDRVMDAGRSLDGLAPSSYEATLAVNIGAGYPVGAFLPIGIASVLSDQDVAWTIQPYMAFLGALLALALWQIAAPLLSSRRLRWLVAVLGSQSALLFGYYLWGGVKEIAAAALIATMVPLAVAAADDGAPRGTLVPLALVAGAAIGVLSGGGALWILPPLAGALVLLARRAGWGRALRRAALSALMILIASLPVIIAGGVVPPTSSPLTSGEAKGNLLEPLDLAQVAGIWPAGDFRLAAEEPAPTYLLIAAAVALAAWALAIAVRRRAWGVLLYVAGVLAASLAIVLVGSPWVDGKALATASPAIPFAAALGGAVLVTRGRRVEGAVLLLAVAGGVLWSNVLQYREVNLAPREQLAELETIGELIEGQGPALMTEYQPYGVRHFLRDAEPEGASELRRRQVELADGGTLAKGLHADTDRFSLGALLTYRTLVLRRHPAQSRPPGPYVPIWVGEHYEVWQRPESVSPEVLRHVGLGDATNPIATVSCAEVRDLGEELAGSGAILAARRPATVQADLADGTYPRTWTASDSGTVTPVGPGEVSVDVEVPRSGLYELWLGGSVRSRAELRIDGEFVDSVRHELNNAGLYVRLGEAQLVAGAHEVSIRVDDADLHPGSGGRPTPLGPLVLTDSEPAAAQIVAVSPEEAEERLCGRRWDWIEAVAA